MWFLDIFQRRESSVNIANPETAHPAHLSPILFFRDWSGRLASFENGQLIKSDRGSDKFSIYSAKTLINDVVYTLINYNLGVRNEYFKFESASH